MSTTAPRPADGSPKKKRKQHKDASQPDANGSYPYPQHYGYPGHGAPPPYPYPHQPPPHYPPGPPGSNFSRGPQHPQQPYNPPAPNATAYCQPTDAGYPSGPYVHQPQYNRPSGYGNNQSTTYNASAGKAASRNSGATGNVAPRTDGLVRSISSASRKAKVDSEKARGSYRCGKCGVPKKGHICPYQPKLKRRADEPPPEMRNAATQVEMDEFLVLRRLNIEIQGLPESYTSVPMGDVGAEAHPTPHQIHNGVAGQNMGSPISMPPSLSSGGAHVNMNGVDNTTTTRTSGTDPIVMQKDENASNVMPSSAPL